MSIANTLIRIQEKITSLREGILSAYNILRWKGATMPTNLTASNLGSTIQTIPLRDSIQVEPLNDDTIFVDIDGTILYKLHPNEVASLTELPPPPHRDGMEFAGWTHTLDEIKDGTWHDVGALYTATKGVVHFSIKEKTYVELILKCSSQDFKVSWGDGTEDNNSTMQNGIFSHTYNEGEYDCVIENNGARIAMSVERKYAKFVTGILTLPNGTYSVDFSDTSIVGVNIISGLRFKFLRSHLQAINVPPDDNTTGVPSWFSAVERCNYIRYACYRWKSYTAFDAGGLTTLQNSLRSMDFGDTTQFYDCNIGRAERIKRLKSQTNNFGKFNVAGSYIKTFYARYAEDIAPKVTTNRFKFNNCIFLESIDVDYKYTTTIGNDFSGCSSLKTVDLPAITSIPSQSFQQCESMTHFVVAETCTKIGALSFYHCYSLRYVHIKRSKETYGSITTLGAVSIFMEPSSGFKIYVPSDSIDAYKTATNWSTFADKIYPDTDLIQ